MTINNSVYFAKFKFDTFSQQPEKAGEVCIANISPRERQLRMRFGVRQFVITLVILGAMVALDLNPLWRLSLLFMFWGAAVGYFQARDKT